MASSSSFTLTGGKVVSNPSIQDLVKLKTGDSHLDLSYDPASHFLDGEATITASATERLCRFNLDLRKLDVKSVIVDGHRADFTRDGRELIITPRRPLEAGDGFTVVVDYSGEPGPAPYGGRGTRASRPR